MSTREDGGSEKCEGAGGWSRGSCSGMLTDSVEATVWLRLCQDVGGAEGRFKFWCDFDE
jgi:hypothetical protein